MIFFVRKIYVMAVTQRLIRKQWMNSDDFNNNNEQPKRRVGNFDGK